MSPCKTLGLIVNPIAGMGGRVGLKGTDGEDILRLARELGAVPSSPGRAAEALQRLIPFKQNLELLACPDEMGGDEAKACSFGPKILGSINKGSTTSADTRNAAREMMKARVDLILFAGGDGTARDICEAVGENVPVLGIPAGVKIHSAVFAISPRSAGDLALMYLREEAVSLREAEVMDIDEQAFRKNQLSVRLFGYLRVPYEQTMVQTTKSSSPVDEDVAMEAIADDFKESMQRDCVYVFGPGTTTRAIMNGLGLKKTLLGFDVVYNHKLIASDVGEKKLAELIQGKNARIVVAVIGGQGFILGRGSQQISPEIIRTVGRDSIMAVATPGKLKSLRGRPLLVDTGDAEVDRMLTGYIQVITGYRSRSVQPVRSN
jgi:predicted polyphosphate/ATP-dependent NAD kinase